MTTSRLGSPRTKIWLLTAAALLPLLTLVWLLGSWVGARGADLWVLRLGLGAACFALAVGVGVWLQGRLPKEQPAQLGGDELDTTVAAAKTRLAASRAAGTASLGELPLVLILGPAGAAKTSSAVHSGLDPDLLAGEVLHGDRITPTAWVNLWYTHKTILLEVGAKVAGDPGRWQRLLRYARPSRLRALLPGRAQAARAVVVCFSCEELVKPGSATAVPAAAAELRKVLVELAQEFGILLPVYVLFTKADRVPCFAEYVRNLSRDETREILGATLTWPPVTVPGLYGEREFQRINAALERLYQSLADKRVPLLARESDTDRRGDAYEFPRELRKLIPVASQFLLELCRPSQLQVNPVLRGFYFTGVRPVVVRDAGPPISASAAPGRGRVGATQMFDAAEPSAPAAQPVEAGGRKIPEWLFLGRLFREVLLGDRVATVAALGSLRVNLVPRVALSAVAAFSLLWFLGQPISCSNNRTLAARAVGALRDLRVASPREGELADLDALRNLDTGRAQLERLADYERHGPPLRMRFGLYQGSRLYEQLGKTYLNEFERVLLEPTRQSLQRALRTAVDSGGTRARTFELLRAYLMTTTHPERIEPAYLTPILLRQWQGTWQVDPQRRGLAEGQFEFYAAKLCPTGACQPGRADQATLDRARVFLKDFSAPEALYQQLVATANAGTRAVRFAGASALFDSLEVPGAFTPAGWEAARRYLADEANFVTEDWVLEQPPGDPSRIRETLRALYRDEYVRQWRRFLEGAAVSSFSRGNAGDRLKELAAPQTSPLVRVLALIARNTDVDPERVGRFFQPVHVLTPPGAKDSTTELMKPYFSALRELQVLVDEAATAAPAAAQQLSDKISQSARSARTSVGQLEDSFRGDGETVAVGAAVGNLLGAPIDRVEALMRGLPGMAVNSIAERFCQQAFEPLSRHFPFNAAGPDADLSDFAAMFQPEEGELSRFYNDALRDVLVRSGSQFTARQGSRVSPTFLNFFNRAAAVSAALWKPSSPEPQFDFVLLVQPPAGAPRITLSMSGQRAVWEQRHRPVGTFRWMGEPGQAALTAQLRGVETDLRTFTGVWAIFRLFRDATGWRPAAGESGSYLVQFNYPDRGVALDAQLNVAGRTPILKPDFFGGLRCVSRVIQ